MKLVKDIDNNQNSKKILKLFYLGWVKILIEKDY